MGKKSERKTPMVNIYMDGNTHVSVVNGNIKLGKGIACVNLLAGSKPLTTKAGKQLINISGTCEGCDKDCSKCCYAIKSQLANSSEKNLISWGNNTVLAKNDPDLFFKELQNYLNKSIIPAFRYHSFGEIPSLDYLKGMISLAKKNSDTMFYFYTKRFEWLEQCISSIPNNLHALVSIWNKNYDNPFKVAEFIYDDGSDNSLTAIPHCPAVDKNGRETGITCAQCKRCIKAEIGMRTAVYAH